MHSDRGDVERWVGPGVAALAFCGYSLLRSSPWTAWDVARCLLLGASLAVLHSQLRRSTGSSAALASVALIGFSPAVLAGSQGEPGWTLALRFSVAVLGTTIVAEADRRVMAAFGAVSGWLAWTTPTDLVLLFVPLATARRSRVRVFAVLAAAGAAAWLLGWSLGQAAALDRAWPAPVDALWSPRGGLLYWQPILWLSVLALFRGWMRREGPAFWTSGAVLLLAAAPSTNQDLGRWIVVLPLLAVPLVRALGSLVHLARRRPALVLAGAGLVLLVWNQLLMAQYREAGFPRDRTVSFVDLEEGNARILTHTLGSPLTWPASWLFAARSGLPAFRYEMLAGRSLFEGSAGLSGRLDIGDDRPLEDILLGEGWGVRHPSRAGVCRDVLDRAQVFAPLARPGRADLRVVASGVGSLALWQDDTRVAEVLLDPTSSTLRVRSLRLPRGLTVFTLRPGADSTACVASWDLASAGPAAAPESGQN